MILVIILALGFFVMGFMNIVRQSLPGEPDIQGVKRQISGFGYISLSGLILGIGSMLCFGMAGGVKELGKSMKGVLGSN